MHAPKRAPQAGRLMATRPVSPRGLGGSLAALLLASGATLAPNSAFGQVNVTSGSSDLLASEDLTQALVKQGTSADGFTLAAPAGGANSDVVNFADLEIEAGSFVIDQGAILRLEDVPPAVPGGTLDEVTFVFGGAMLENGGALVADRVSGSSGADTFINNGILSSFDFTQADSSIIDAVTEMPLDAADLQDTTLDLGDGADTLENSGLLDGNVLLGAGNDTLTLSHDKVIDGTSQGGEVIEGSFSSTQLVLPESVSADFIVLETIYGPNSVEVRIRETNGSDLIGAARGDNQRAVAERIGAGFNSGAEAARTLLPALSPFALTDDASLRAFLDRQAPLQGGAIQQSTATGLGQVLNRANRRLGQLGAAPGALPSLSPQASGQFARLGRGEAAGADRGQAAQPSAMAEERFGVWLEGLGARSNVEGDNNAQGFDSTAWGVVGGIDYRISETFALGLFGGYTELNADFDGSARDDATSDQIHGGIHGGVSAGALSLRAALGYARLDNETARDTGTGSIAHAEFEGQAWFGGIEGGYLFEAGAPPEALRIGPSLALRTAHVDSDSRLETRGGVLNQYVDDGSYTSLLGKAGAALAWDFGFGGGLLTPYGSLALSYEFADTNTTATGGFANVPGAGRFEVDGPEVDRAAIKVGFGAMAKPSASWPLSVSLDYNGRYNRDIADQALTAGLRLAF